MGGNVLFKCIVVADDGSIEGERAANMAIQVAIAFRAHVVLVGVIEPPNIQAQGEGLPVPEPSAIRRTLEERLGGVMRTGNDLGLRLSLLIREGSVAREIINVAKQEFADLIVVSRRHVSRLHRLLRRGTFSEIVHTAPCAVLVVN